MPLLFEDNAFRLLKFHIQQTNSNSNFYDLILLPAAMCPPYEMTTATIADKMTLLSICVQDVQMYNLL